MSADLGDARLCLLNIEDEWGRTGFIRGTPVTGKWVARVWISKSLVGRFFRWWEALATRRGRGGQGG